MQKIISLFQRNYDGDRLVRDELVPGAEWVAAGEGLATRKWDGTCCLVRGGQLFKRFDAKNGKTPPNGFEPAQDPDPVTGHWPGWLPIGSGPADQWHREAWYDFQDRSGRVLSDGTYELLGPKINGNPEGFKCHALIAHGTGFYPAAPRTFAGLLEFFLNDQIDIEGLVWHHPDGRMVKIKMKDFGLKRRRFEVK